MQQDHLRELFKEEGRRLTSQRLLVLEVLERSEKHLDAEALHERVRGRNPNVSLATVYRTLAVLKEMGLVEENRLGQEHAHYEAAQQDPHYHFVCRECGRVIEFESPLVDQAIQRLCQEQGICVTDTHLRLSGRCARCRALAGERSDEN